MPAALALGVPREFAIDADRFARRPTSATFHGRDLFAPVAAALAGGLPIERVGLPAADPLRLAVEPPARTPGALRGQVVYIDPFGNIVTNIPGGWLGAPTGSIILEHPGGRATVRRAATYAEAPPGEPVALVGSDGTVEIAINGGRAADALAIRAGALVTLHTKPTSS